MPEESRIARTLRSARERLGLSVEGAAADSGVPPQYIRLLEGETRVRVGVADELYLIPFFRRYAAFLGLDPAELIPELLAQVQQVPAPAGGPVRLAYPSRLARLWKPAAIVLAVGLATFLLVRRAPERPVFDDASEPHAGQTVEPPGAAPAHDAGATVPPGEAALAEADAAVATEPVSAEAAAEAERATPGPAASPAVDGARHELRIVASEETWLAIGIDGEPRKEFLLKPGQTLVRTASVTFTLTVGNAGGITLALDGRELPPLGRSGEVVRLTLPELAGDGPPRG
jgi:cytoskeleton protein RodZ